MWAWTNVPQGSSYIAAVGVVKMCIKHCAFEMFVFPAAAPFIRVWSFGFLKLQTPILLVNPPPPNKKKLTCAIC